MTRGVQNLLRARWVLLGLLLSGFLLQFVVEGLDLFSETQRELVMLFTAFLVALPTIALVHVFCRNFRITTVMLLAGTSSILSSILYLTRTIEALAEVPIIGADSAVLPVLTDAFDWAAICGALVGFFLVVFQTAATKIELIKKSESLEREIEERKTAERERQELEAQIHHAQKLESIGVLAGGIAHDFNNLLMGVLGNASLAKEDAAPDSELYERVGAIERSAELAADLTNQLLTYAGRSQVEIQPIDLSKVVQEMAELLAVSVDKNADLQLQLDNELPALLGDISQVRQVVLNLLTNASEALEGREGTIRLKTGSRDCSESYLKSGCTHEKLPEGEYVYLEVFDTGQGISEDTLMKIFDPFFTTKVTGRGLGLSGVIGIVRGHKGTVRVDSVEGQGATFTVVLPQAKDIVLPVAVAPAELEEAPCAGTILVVDDEEIVRNVTRDALKRAGYSVLLAEDGVDGVEVFRERARDIDLVVLDLTMPRMDGHEALKLIREIDENAKVILTSGHTEDQVYEHLASNGACEFIHKPYRPKQLIALVQNQLAQPVPVG